MLYCLLFCRDQDLCSYCSFDCHIISSKSHYGARVFNSTLKIKICQAQFWKCHFQRQGGSWGLRNHVQLSMQRISYFQLHLCLPVWRGWLKISWHILTLMSSQAQTVSGKTILAPFSVKMFVLVLSIFSTICWRHCAASFFFLQLSPSISLLYLFFAITEIYQVHSLLKIPC